VRRSRRGALVQIGGTDELIGGLGSTGRNRRRPSTFVVAEDVPAPLVAMSSIVALCKRRSRLFSLDVDCWLGRWGVRSQPCPRGRPSFGRARSGFSRAVLPEVGH